MEDRDDGIGSEINTPRDVQHVKELGHNPEQESDDENKIGHLVASYPPPSLVFPNSSTPVRPQTQHISQHIPEISPIRQGPPPQFINDANAGDKVHGEIASNKEYTILDLAVLLRDKHSECIELEVKNKQSLQLIEKLTSENHHFQDQIAVIKVCASSLTEETEKLKEVLKQKDTMLMECQHQLQIAEQKLTLFENISIDIETDKMADAETLKKLQDENAVMKAKISELKLELAIEKEGERNAEIWRGKYDDMEKDREAMLRAKTELETELRSAKAKIARISKEKSDCDEKCSKFKCLFEENANKAAELQNQLLITEQRFKHLQESNLNFAELEQKLEMEKKTWEEEREHLHKEKSGLEKRIEQLALANYRWQKFGFDRQSSALIKSEVMLCGSILEINIIVFKYLLLRKALSTEKQALLEADNKGLKDVAAWQEKNKKLTLQNAQLADELKKYRDIDLRLTQCLDELKKKDSLIDELNGQITKSNNDLKRFRDEAVYLRTQLSEKTKSKKEIEEDWTLKKEELLADFEHLKETVAKNHNLEDQVASEKQKNSELVSLLERREAELNNIRDIVEKNQKRIEELMEEKVNLKRENVHLKTVVDKINAEYNIFRNQAEVQYQLETAQLKQVIGEKDERLERLHARIALFESYPGQSGVFSCSTDSNSHTNITRYQDLNTLVHRMMSDPPAKQYATITKVVENKSTSCSVHSSHSELMGRSHPRLAVCEAESIDSSAENLTATLHREGINETKDPLFLMLDSVRRAEIRSKLSPNIQQLLEHLLTNIQESNKSVEQISGAVNDFFANLDLALRKTLSASDDNRIKCEELEKLCTEITADLHDARDELHSALNKCSMYEANIDSLKLQFRSENRNCIDLHSKLMHACEEIDNLTKQKDDLSVALSEAKIMLKRKTDLGSQAATTIKCIKDELHEAKKFEDEMNERLRKICKEKEKVKQLLSERELDVVKLECRLVESTTRASELQRAESKIDELERRNDYLKRKYDKREGFLEEMEALLRGMKVRCEGLRETNRLRQNLIVKLKKLLVKLGYNLDDPNLVEGGKATAFEGRTVRSLKKSKTHDTAKIEELENCRDSDVVHIPSWRSLNSSVSISPASIRADKLRSASVTTNGSNPVNRATSENGFNTL
uniref:Uncharacterized protein n=1 Tax=Setaria digitata TaxID=48799 RepID=A0A915PSB2_9BILA